MKHPSDISILDFTYDLPSEKIALYPLEQRDESKLLVVKSGKITESIFKSITEFLPNNSLMVFNTTKVVNARLNFQTEKKQHIEVFCLEPDENTLELKQAMSQTSNVRWRCLVGNLKRWKEEVLTLRSDQVSLHASIIEKKEQYVVIEFFWTPTELSFSQVLQNLGHVPIPPYLKRNSDVTDEKRYQTVYADTEGSVAAPTAGLHFTEEVLNRLSSKKIQHTSVTLHVGAGTFKPVKSLSMREHEMHAEWMDVSVKTIKELFHIEAQKIIAVGTTSLRTLESLYWMGLKAYLNREVSLSEMEIKQWDVYDLVEHTITKKQSLTALLDWMQRHHLEKIMCKTQILIAPPYQLKIADGLVTNFHQPQSTLLLLVAAILGNSWKEVYHYALTHDFRFLSYGDSSLLLK